MLLQWQGTFLILNGTFPNMVAVFVGSQSGFSFKNPAEIGGVVDVNVVSDFFAAEISENKKPFCFQQ